MENRLRSENQERAPNFSESAESLFDRYSNRLKEIADLLREDGHDVTVFSSTVPSRFPELEKTKQIDILDAIEGTLSIYASAIRSGVSVKDHRQMAWWALQKLGYRPLSDAFAHIEDRNVVEIYDEDHKQIFRTLNFFPCLSYSLDEINTYEWWELYERADSVTQTMHKTVAQLMSRPPASILKPFPTHWVEERFSERKNWAKIESKILTPITRVSGTTVVGYLNAFEVLELRKRRDV